MNTENHTSHIFKTQYTFFEVLPYVLAPAAAIAVAVFATLPLFTNSHGMQYNNTGENIIASLTMVVIAAAAWQSHRRPCKRFFSCFMASFAILYSVTAI